MPAPPKYQIPGLRRGAGIPAGYLVGRLPHAGKGPAQLLTVQQLAKFGGPLRPSASVLGNQAGFTFSVTGLPKANEFVGQGSWSKQLTFHNGDPNNSVNALVPATSTAVMRIMNAALAEIGTITFAAGSAAGVVAWITDPFVIPAGQLVLLYCPLTADATLANISGRVVGYT